MLNDARHANADASILRIMPLVSHSPYGVQGIIPCPPEACFSHTPYVVIPEKIIKLMAMRPLTIMVMPNPLSPTGTSA